MIATLAGVVLSCSVSSAGTYDVPACDAAGGVNNSWLPVVQGAAWTTAYGLCPTNGDKNRGLIARNIVQGGAVSGGVSARLQFTAPAGTSIIGVRATDDFYVANNQWEAALSTGSQILRGCGEGSAPGCTWASPDEWVPVPHSGLLWIDASCSGNSCQLDSGDASHGYVMARARMASAVVRVEDNSVPSIGSVSGGLWDPGWKRGTQTVAFDAQDDTGIRQTEVVIDGQSAGRTAHACDATHTVPCPNGGASFDVKTGGLSDGQHQIGVQATDAAGNPGTVTRSVLVDNSPPGAPQGVQVDGGEGWRSSNLFAVHWTDPKVDGAQVAAANWQLCPASGTTSRCITGSAAGDGLAVVPDVKVPGDGDWSLRLWLVDQAGNQTIDNAAPAVHLRLDGEAPSAVFAPSDPVDPTKVVIQASDGVSGVGSGTVEIKPHASQTWTTIPAALEGGRLVAVLPDESLRDGVYDLRGHAVDLAGNERTTTTLADGTPVSVSLPVRAKTHLTGGRPHATRSHGRRMTVLAAAVTTPYGRRVQLRGCLVNAAGHAIGGTVLQVLERAARAHAPWRLTRTVKTSRTGRFAMKSTGNGTSRTIRVRYPGTPTVRPSQVQVRLAVAASSTIHSSRRNVRAGGAVRFFGRLQGGHVPAGGKLVQLQVLVNGKWQVFANPRTDKHGRWMYRYRFTGRYRAARFAFRLGVPRDPAYPFATGRSAALRVRVRGP